MHIEDQIEIERPIEEVFAFVADARNDPQWCPRVFSCKQVEGEGPGPGARYEARHRPTLLPPHIRRIEVLEYDAPTSIRWRQSDLGGVFEIDYRLTPTEKGTRLTQSDEIAWKVPRLFHPVARRIVRKHIPDQMADLKRLLESRAAAGESSVAVA